MLTITNVMTDKHPKPGLVPMPELIPSSIGFMSKISSVSSISSFISFASHPKAAQKKPRNSFLKAEAGERKAFFSVKTGSFSDIHNEHVRRGAGK